MGIGGVQTTGPFEEGLRLKVNNRNEVYDADLLTWVPMKQPLIDAANSNLYLAVDGVEGKLDTLIAQKGAYILKIYSDASYDYLCQALPGTALATAAWRVRRIDAAGSILMAGGNANFDNAATDLVTVQGYSYS